MRPDRLRVGYPRAHVQDFVDDRAHRRLLKLGEHFVRRGRKRLLDDVEREAVRAVGARAEPTECRSATMERLQFPFGKTKDVNGHHTIADGRYEV